MPPKYELEAYSKYGVFIAANKLVFGQKKYPCTSQSRCAFVTIKGKVKMELLSCEERVAQQ